MFGEGRQESGKSTEIPLSDNRAQIALARVWYLHDHQGQDADRNAIMGAWIESGLATTYRTYIESEGSDSSIDVSNDEALAAVVEALEKRTLH
jgi:hypothetical protein